MDFSFEVVPYDREKFVLEILPTISRASAVYRIFDTQNKLIVLDRTSALAQRLERFYGPRSETAKDLDLRNITSRIEYAHTASPFETTYLLYLQRRQWFPKTYRKMRTFRLFTLMKINRRQRFPRIFASRQVKAGVDYFGPFVSRSQFTRLKTALERTFKLRPCLYNIRGNDPRPDCLYFQMRTCSRPCNNDISRDAYLEDVHAAIAFVQGRDGEIEPPLLDEITRLAAAMKFEQAETLRRQLEKTRRARQEMKDRFFLVWSFNYLIVLPSHTAARRRIAFVREGSIVGFEEYEMETIAQNVEDDAQRIFDGPMPKVNRDWQYDEFCMVSSLLLDPLQSADTVPYTTPPGAASDVLRAIEQGRKKSRREVNDDR